MILKPKPFRKLRYGPHWSKTGLVGLWLKNEGSGKTVADLSGNENTGILGSGSSWIGGQFGNALSFDGNAGGYLNCGSSTTLDDLHPLFLSFWVFLTSGSDGEAFVRKHANREWWIGVGASGDRLRFFVDGTGGDIDVETAGGTLSTNVWTHIGLNWSGSAGNASDIKFYKNGVFLAHDNAVNGGTILSDADGSLYIGGVQGQASFSPVCQMDTTSLYNRVFTASEIQQLYLNPFIMFDRDEIELWAAATQGVAVVGNAGIMTTNTGFWGATF